MPDRPRSTLLAYGIAVIAVALVGAMQLRGRPEPEPARAAPLTLSDAEPRAGAIYVHVAGAVRRPGVVRVRPGSRVQDAVERAGGLTRRADLAAVNLAAKLEDGRQVIVPERARVAPPGALPSDPGVSAAGAGAAAGPVNLNTATLEQLDQLDGIGPALAQRILTWRERNGGFKSVEDLSQVPGIGDIRMAALREAVTV